jgi:hypothetical protein
MDSQGRLGADMLGVTSKRALKPGFVVVVSSLQVRRPSQFLNADLQCPRR